EQVLRTLGRIGSVEHVDVWLDEMFEQKNKISGFGHRVYKAYDPRARILGPLAAHLARNNRYGKPLYAIARRLEEAMLDRVGRQKKVFPNVDFYSGIVYRCMGIDPEMYTPLFAVSRVAGWTARVHEYLQHNRIFRPRAMYVGQCDQRFVPVEQRGEASV
ncbi:MAG: citrate/2-methylcitrate synthase, partial [Deltaproteobacteria bacterium]|nr:citrate/2-methylcitrate synthase [Deltaproteobacteria bacterium]